MKVSCYNDETYTWQIVTDPDYEHADWYADIPNDVVDRYLKAQKAYLEARKEMRDYVYRVKP